MPCFSGEYKLAWGPVVNLGIAAPGTAAQGQSRPFPALIDTGASSTCIAASVADAIDVQPIGKQPMVSATGAEPVNQYIVDLVLPFSPPVALPSLQVLEFVQAMPTAFQILLGRDVLCQGVFTLNFDGTYMFCL